MYRITLKNPKGVIIHQRERTRMDSAVEAAVHAVDRMHEITKTQHGLAHVVDQDSARGWNPRQGEVVIQRNGYALTLGKR